MGQIVTVDFHGDTLCGFKTEDGKEMIAVKPIVESIGIDWNGQYQRIKRDPILSEGMCVMHVPFGRGGAHETVCLPLERLHGWLFTVDSTRIKNDETRAKVILYQRECYQTLFEHFRGKPDAAVTAYGPKPPWQLPWMSRLRMVAQAQRSLGTRKAQELWVELQLPLFKSVDDDLRRPNLFTYAADEDPRENDGQLPN